MTPDQATVLWNALFVFATGLLAWLGTNFAKKSHAKPELETVEIAGAVINAKDAQMLVTSFDAAAAQMGALAKELVEHRRSLDRNSAICEDVRDSTNHVNHGLLNLANALLLSRK